MAVVGAGGWGEGLHAVRELAVVVHAKPQSILAQPLHRLPWMVSALQG